MEVAAIKGHKDLGMLLMYTHLRAEDLSKARLKVSPNSSPALKIH